MVVCHLSCMHLCFICVLSCTFTCRFIHLFCLYSAILPLICYHVYVLILFTCSVILFVTHLCTCSVCLLLSTSLKMIPSMIFQDLNKGWMNDWNNIATCLSRNRATVSLDKPLTMKGFIGNYFLQKKQSLRQIVLPWCILKCNISALWAVSSILLYCLGMNKQMWAGYLKTCCTDNTRGVNMFCCVCHFCNPTNFPRIILKNLVATDNTF